MGRGAARDGVRHGGVRARRGGGRARLEMGCGTVGERAQREWGRGMVGEGAVARWMDEQPSHDGGDLFLRGRSAADWEMDGGG